MENKITFELGLPEPKVHSVRFNPVGALPANSEKAVTGALYINRPFFQNAKRLRVTIEEVSE